MRQTVRVERLRPNNGLEPTSDTGVGIVQRAIRVIRRLAIVALGNRLMAVAVAVATRRVLVCMGVQAATGVIAATVRGVPNVGPKGQQQLATGDEENGKISPTGKHGALPN